MALWQKSGMDEAQLKEDIEKNNGGRTPNMRKLKLVRCSDKWLLVIELLLLLGTKQRCREWKHRETQVLA